MKKTIFTIMLISTLLAACGTGDLENQKQTITIGVSSANTGDLAFIGQSTIKSTQIALEELNSKESKYKYAIIYEDDQFSSKLAATTAQKLIDNNQADVLISEGSSAGIVVSGIAEQRGVPHINAGASSSDVAKGKYNFIHWTSPNAQAEKFVEELLKRNVKNVAAITLNHEGAQAISIEALDLMQKKAIKLLGNEKFEPGEKDFRTIWKKTEALSPDLVFFVTASPEFELLLEQRLALGIDIPVATIESPAYTDRPELYNGNWYVDAAVPTNTFTAKFEARYGETPRVFAANSYDVVHIIAEIYETTEGEVTPEIFRAKVYEIVQDYDGAFGRFSVDENGVFVSEATVKEMVNGESVLSR